MLSGQKNGGLKSTGDIRSGLGVVHKRHHAGSGEGGVRVRMTNNVEGCINTKYQPREKYEVDYQREHPSRD